MKEYSKKAKDSTLVPRISSNSDEEKFLKYNDAASGIKQDTAAAEEQ